MRPSAIPLVLPALPAALLTMAACAAEAPPPQIALARLTGSGCVAYPGQPIDRVCIPRAAREGTPIALEVEQRCASCSASIERCTVSVEGRDVTLSLDGRSCTVDRACSEACTNRRAVCRLPALALGRYTLRYADRSGRVDVLEVAAGGAERCALDDGA